MNSTKVAETAVKYFADDARLIPDKAPNSSVIANCNCSIRSELNFCNALIASATEGSSGGRINHKKIGGIR